MQNILPYLKTVQDSANIMFRVHYRVNWTIPPFIEKLQDKQHAAHRADNRGCEIFSANLKLCPTKRGQGKHHVPSPMPAMLITARGH